MKDNPSQKALGAHFKEGKIIWLKIYHMEIIGNDLTFISIREFERIKHVHKVLCKG
jgi:hypothetical protein